MQFAINYSPQAADLLTHGALAIDRFKCPDWPDMIATAQSFCPVYVHFDLRADPHLNATLDFDAIARWCDATDTPYVNLHLSPRPENYPAVARDTTDPRDIAAVTDAMLAGIALVVEHFDAEHVVLENVPYYALEGNVMRPASEPAVIRRVVEESGCGFLFDISHARLSARHMGLDEEAYIAQMPGEHLRELHVTGIGRDQAGHVRDHLALTDADWPFLDRVLDRIRSGEWAQPWVMAFEYGGIGPLFDWRSESSVIAAQVPLLADRAHALD